MTSLNSPCLEKLKAKVTLLLQNEQSGHAMDHVERVLALSLDFAQQEKADQNLVALIALLHDVDDYKLFGTQHSAELSNAKTIMRECSIDNNIQTIVLQALSCIGYSKRLQGLEPTILEGQIVSDADMCDTLGAHGILRAHSYQLAHHYPFFDRAVFPANHLTPEQYLHNPTVTGIGHFFEKLLRLKNLMLTTSGQREAATRHQFMIDFLYQFFAEENAPEWTEYLDQFLAQNP